MNNSYELHQKIEKSVYSIFLKSTKLTESTQSIFYSNQNIRKIQKFKIWKNQKIREIKKFRNLKRIKKRLKSHWINFNQQNSQNERDESFFKIRNANQNKY